MSNTKDLCELLGTDKDFVVIGTHPVLVESLSKSLGIAFAGNESALVLFAALDKTRENSIKRAVQSFDNELELPQIQVTTAQILEQLMSTDTEQFSSMLRECRRCIVWLHPRDFLDNTLGYWFRVYHKLPCRVPVAYFAAFEPDESVFKTCHEAIEWIRHPVKKNGGLPAVYYMNDGGRPLFSREFADRCQKKKTIVSCRDEYHKVRYSEASHGIQIPVIAEKKSGKSAFQVVSDDAFSDYALPDIKWDHYVCVDPLPGEDLAERSRFFGLRPDATSIMTTSQFSLLSALSNHHSQNETDETLLDIYDLFQRLNQGSVEYPESEILSSCIDYWCECGYVMVIGRRAELTETGRQLFPGTVSFSQFGVLHSYHHDTPCQAKNRAYLGLIESKLLLHKMHFYVASQMFETEFHNALGNEAILKMADSMDSAIWLDRIPVFYSRQQMTDIESVLFNEKEDFSGIPDSQSLETIRKIRNEFKSAPGHQFIEVTPGCAHWWTFSGAENNSLLAKILFATAPKLGISFGNFYIRLQWPELPASALPRIIERLKTIHSQVMTAINEPEKLPGSVKKSWEQSHVYSWMFVIIPPDYREMLFEQAMKNLEDSMETDIPIVETDKLHCIDELPKSDEKTVDLPPIQSVAMSDYPKVCDKFNAPLSSMTKPYPIVEGVMHTRYPWYYIDNDVLFARAMNIILQQAYISLDVETTLFDHRLCLIQIGCSDRSFLIDPFKVDFLGLAQVLSHPNIPVIIHNATFERTVMGGYQIQIQNIIDTMRVSQKIYGMKCPGGHSLKSVCNREFGLNMSKECQTSRWETRPLTAQQLEYAALDAEILIHLYRKFFNKA